MPSASIFSLIRQGLAHAKFESSETRNVINEAIDSLESADNDRPVSLDEDVVVQDAVESIQRHLAELLGNPITVGKDDNDKTRADFGEEDPDEDEIER